MTLDYFYGQTGELFSFYRIPKALFQEQRFQSLSTDAKTLYGILLDRMSLSAKNGWYDSSGRVYIYYPLDAVEADLCCGHGKAVRLMAELDSGTGIGLIERVRQGLCKPSIIYVKQFTSRAVPLPAALLVNNDVEPFEVPKSNVRMFDTKTSGLPIIEPSEVSKLEILNMKKGMHWNDFANYRKVWGNGAFLKQLRTTLVFVFGTVGLEFVIGLALALLLVVALPAAYCLSRFHFKGCKVLNTLFMAGLFINVNYIVVPIFLMLRDGDVWLKSHFGSGFLLKTVMRMTGRLI